MSLLLWATTYVALDYVGLLTVLPEFGIALFFPAAGIAAAWILVTPVSRAGWVASIVLVATTLVAMTRASRRWPRSSTAWPTPARSGCCTWCCAAGGRAPRVTARRT